ncbi:cation-translocating P-type ATPase [Eubacterium limosum]|uniref:Cd(2+)-exporting ATPase n=1 Tax=Eubacterium limosum TaxID=1736 RepID=A0ABT5UTJ7_EUBLI|nr:cation-translocating P-type ATPase [Eubacterium limosum]MCB6570890.1 cation-translocating P-type ATPase [Eubacterium limosum]MDE1471983.1 cation-translocating P-type ATPase [Eubacterium limosum]
MMTWLKDEEKRTVAAMVISALALGIHFVAGDRLAFDLSWIAVVLCGLPIIIGAVVAVIKEFDIRADVLVSIAIIASVAIGEVFAAGEIAVIMTLGGYLEERTVNKARKGIERLVDLTPEKARVMRDGVEVVIDVEDVAVGEAVRVLPGEKIPVDGIVLCGDTAVDQSLMTGESLPVDKEKGDEVFCGTMNQFGTVDIRVTRAAEDSSLKRMIRLVESADAGRAPISHLADRLATVIVVLALTAAVVTGLVTGELTRAVTILVVFCPCALVLATPTAIMAGIGNAAKNGILIRSGDVLERLASVGRIAFDKTGTITYGKPCVRAFECEEAWEKDALLKWTAAAEARSEHPLGKAVSEHYAEGHPEPLPEPSEFAMLPGKGVHAVVEGHEIAAGNRKLLDVMGITVTESLEKSAKKYLSEGGTIIYIAVDGKAAGYAVLADTLRNNAPNMVEKLRAQGLKTALITGDHRAAALYMAERAGIDTVEADCLPEDKIDVIKRLQGKGQEKVCMIGDGINDAPALKTADVGLAMGDIGSDIAMDAADAVFVGDDVMKVPYLMTLSQKTMRTIRVNIFLSQALNAVAVVLAMTGIMGPVAGALVHNVGSVAVIISSAMLLNFNEKKNGKDRQKTSGSLKLSQS